MSDSIFNLKNSIPNKIMHDDGSITDFIGNKPKNPVSIYDAKPALPNKFLNPDGTYSTFGEIMAAAVDTTIFVPVTELPDVGNENKIYLLPSSDGYFYEYHYANGKWDPIGVLKVDLSSYSTTEQITEMINNESEAMKAYVDDLVGGNVPDMISEALKEANEYTDKAITEKVTAVLGGEY